MKPAFAKLRVAAGVGMASLMTVFSSATHAQGPGIASPWSNQKYGPMRLVVGLPQAPGVTPAAGKIYAGVHIKLDSGWKTYWRQPGDSGVPPSFDWTGSVNDLSPCGRRQVSATRTFVEARNWLAAN